MSALWRETAPFLWHEDISSWTPWCVRVSWFVTGRTQVEYLSTSWPSSVIRRQQTDGQSTFCIMCLRTHDEGANRENVAVDVILDATCLIVENYVDQAAGDFHCVLGGGTCVPAPLSVACEGWLCSSPLASVPLPRRQLSEWTFAVHEVVCDEPWWRIMKHRALEHVGSTVVGQTSHFQTWLFHVYAKGLKFACGPRLEMHYPGYWKELASMSVTRMSFVPCVMFSPRRWSKVSTHVCLKVSEDFLDIQCRHLRRDVAGSDDCLWTSISYASTCDLNLWTSPYRAPKVKNKSETWHWWVRMNDSNWESTVAGPCVWCQSLFQVLWRWHGGTGYVDGRNPLLCFEMIGNGCWWRNRVFFLMWLGFVVHAKEIGHFADVGAFFGELDRTGTCWVFSQGLEALEWMETWDVQKLIEVSWCDDTCGEGCRFEKLVWSARDGCNWIFKACWKYEVASQRCVLVVLSKFAMSGNRQLEVWAWDLAFVDVIMSVNGVKLLMKSFDCHFVDFSPSCDWLEAFVQPWGFCFVHNIGMSHGA